MSERETTATNGDSMNYYEAKTHFTNFYTAHTDGNFGEFKKSIATEICLHREALMNGRIDTADVVERARIDALVVLFRTTRCCENRRACMMHKNYSCATHFISKWAPDAIMAWGAQGMTEVDMRRAEGECR